MRLHPIVLDKIPLVRDIIGENTVYYTHSSATLKTTSHAPQSLSPGVSRLNHHALVDYLSCAFVPGERTMFDGVHELRPGAQWDGLGNAPKDVPFQLNEDHFDRPQSWYANHLRELLEAVIATQLQDVRNQPVGIFLSGGLDSSLVAAFVKKLHTGPVHTISIHFGDAYPSELAWSSAVAAHIGSEHHILEVPTSIIASRTRDVMGMLDDPIGDPLTTPNLLMFEHAKSLGITHIFNGEGGDPTFGGPKNVPMVLHHLYGGDLQDLSGMYFRSFQKCYDDLDELLTARVLRPTHEEQSRLLTPYLQDDTAVMSSFLNRLMWMNVRLKGADHILAKVRNLGFHTKVQACSPLFDRRIVQAGFEIPAVLKLNGRREKAVLKDAVAGMLPEAVIERPKSGMMVPVQRWFRGPLRPWAESVLLDKTACLAPYLNRSVIEGWLRYEQMTYPRHGVKIWLIIALELWMQTHGFPAEPWTKSTHRRNFWSW